LDFGALLAGFADRLDDPIWNSWFAVVHAIRKSRNGFLPMQRFNPESAKSLRRTSTFGASTCTTQNLLT